MISHLRTQTYTPRVFQSSLRLYFSPHTTSGNQIAAHLLSAGQGWWFKGRLCWTHIVEIWIHQSHCEAGHILIVQDYLGYQALNNNHRPYFATFRPYGLHSVIDVSCNSLDGWHCSGIKVRCTWRENVSPQEPWEAVKDMSCVRIVRRKKLFSITSLYP